MGLNVKKILSMSGAIAASVATGGVTAPILIPAGLNLAAEFFPGEDTDKKAREIAAKAELDHWEKVMIVSWVETYKRLLLRGIGNLAQVFKGKVESDFIMNYADDPEPEWVESIYEMVEKAVRWQIATSETTEA